jgi:Concanavalin A-like lectin/glucanases superfamily
MKTRIGTSRRLMSVLAGLVIAGSAGSSLAGPPQYNERFPPFSGSLDLMSVARTADDGLVSAGAMWINPTTSWVHLATIGPLGETGLQKFYAIASTSGRSRATCVRVLSDPGKNFLIAGEADDPSGNGREIFMMKVRSTNGVVLWSKRYWGSGFTGLGDTVAREITGGRIALVGRKVGGCPPDTTAAMTGVLIITDSEGVQQQACCWAASTQYSNGTLLSFNDVREDTSCVGATPDLVVVGWYQREHFERAQPFAMRTKSESACDTDVCWSKVYQRDDDPGYDMRGEGMELVPSAGIATGAYLLTGPVRLGGAQAGSFLFQLDAPTGGVNWGFTDTLLQNARSVRRLPSGDAIVTGCSADPGRGMIARYGPGGAWLGSRRQLQPANETETIEEAIPMPDGTVAWVGPSWGGGYDGALAVRTQTVTNPSSGTYCDVGVASAQVGQYSGVDLALVTAPALASEGVSADPPLDNIAVPPHKRCNFFQSPFGTVFVPFDDIGGTVSRNPGDPLDPFYPASNFDEPVHDSAGAVGPGMVLNGLTQHVNIATSPAHPYPEINPGTGPFTLAAWVRKATVDCTVQVIVDHRVNGGGGPGYHWFLGCNNTQGLQLADGTYNNYGAGPATAVPADNRWHFVGVVVDRGAGATQTARFYMDDALVSTIPVGHPGSLDTPTGTSFRIGARNFENTGNFRGGLDEVQFFPRALSGLEMHLLYSASDESWTNAAKSPATSLCDASASYITATSHITNLSNSPAAFSWTATALPVGPGATVAGPTDFFPSSGVTPVLQPGTTIAVPVWMSRPVGMTFAGATAAYQFQVTNTNSRQVSSSFGTLVDTRDLCTTGTVPAIRNVGPSGITLDLMLSNNSGSSMPLTVLVRVPEADLDCDGIPEDPWMISLFGQPAGSAVLLYFGTLPPGQAASLPLPVAFTASNLSGVYTVLLEADLDGDGDYEPLTSQFVRWSSIDDAPPTNDGCANAIAIGEGTFPFDNSFATTDGSTGCGFFGGDTGSHDLWWRYTPSMTGTVEVNTCGQTTLDTELNAFAGGCGGPEIACNDDSCGQQSRIAFPASAGSPVVIRLASYGDDSGAGTFTISISGCGSADFDGDGDLGTDADIESFFACLAGACCSTCGSADFNGDGDLGTDADIESFFRVLGGGTC